jgi:hypothetical protein
LFIHSLLQVAEIPWSGDVRELLRELTVQIYGKITSKLASICQHRQEQASDKETMK